MNSRTFAFTVAVALVGLLTFSSSGFAAHGDGGGGGIVPPDYGDLIILYRDANGVPIPSPAVTVADPETGLLVDGGLCWQPIAFQSDDAGTCPATLLDCSAANPCLVPVDQYNCAIVAEYAGCTQEVDFGRINAARSPDSVFDSQLADVVVNLATADCVTLDPAGRLVASRVVDGDALSGAIDSPIQNLAIYKQLMLTGTIGVPLPADTLVTAARGIGAGSDKGGEVNVDLVAYLNQTMGLSAPATTTILDPKLCETYREEVQGVIQLVEKCFLNYSAYGYDRFTNFGALPAPAYIPADAPVAGTFEYTAYVLTSAPPLFEIVYGPIMDAVFCVDALGNPVDAVSGICPDTIDLGFLAGNVGGFAQAADDTRAVIDFMHNWPVLGDFPTPVPCADSGLISYDISISDVSGLQVPVNMVAGTDREFTLTVANAGPDAATGAVLLTATDSNGEPVPTFPRAYTFTTLAAGANTSWIEGLCVSDPTTITWTATATAAYDVNPDNNSVTELTVVTGTARECSVNVAVPDIGVCETLDSVYATLIGAGLTVNPIVKTDATDACAAGLVTRTEPPSGTIVEVGSEVTIVVATEPVSVAVPDIGVCETLDSVYATLIGAGLTVNPIVKTDATDACAAGLVTRTEPPSGTIVGVGSEVTIVVATEPVADLSDVSITNVLIPLNLSRIGIVKTLSVTVTNAATAAGIGTGTVTLTGTDGSVFADTFTNLAPGLSQTSSWSWTVPSSQTVVWTIEVTVDGAVVDSTTRQTVIQ